MTRQNKRTGRPKLENRINLSKREKQYCRLRAEGLSIQAAADAVGKRAKSMEKAERQWPLLRAEIDINRMETMNFDLDSANDLRMKIMRDLHAQISNLLVTGDLKIQEIDKAYSLLRSMESDLNAIMAQAKKNMPTSSDDQVIEDFPDFMRRVQDGAAKMLSEKCPHCNTKKKTKIPLLSAVENEAGSHFTDDDIAS